MQKWSFSNTLLLPFLLCFSQFSQFSLGKFQKWGSECNWQLVSQVLSYPTMNLKCNNAYKSWNSSLVRAHPVWFQDWLLQSGYPGMSTKVWIPRNSSLGTLGLGVIGHCTLCLSTLVLVTLVFVPPILVPLVWLPLVLVLLFLVPGYPGLSTPSPGVALISSLTPTP